MTETCTSAHAQYSTTPCVAGDLPFTGASSLALVAIISLLCIGIGLAAVFGAKRR